MAAAVSVGRDGCCSRAGGGPDAGRGSRERPTAPAAPVVERFAPVVAPQRQIGNRGPRRVLARYEDEASKKARETAAWEADEARA
jgi:hypothetical protein